MCAVLPAMPGRLGVAPDDAAPGLAFSCLVSAAWRACSAFIAGVATKYCQANGTAAASAMARRTFLLLFMEPVACGAWNEEQDRSPTRRPTRRWDGSATGAAQ